MKKALNWAAWVTACLLAPFLAVFEIASGRMGDHHPTFSDIMVSILLGIAIQVGLFLSPWALEWRDQYQKIVFLAMLPSIFWLVVQIVNDLGEVSEHLANGQATEARLHAAESVVMAAFLAIYLTQATRVSIDFLRKPSPYTPSQIPRE